MFKEGPSGPFALRLYTGDEGTGQLMCDYGEEYLTPQWHHSVEKRMTWQTAEDALNYLTDVVHERWPEFRTEDVRVVRVVPPKREQYIEVISFGCPEPSTGAERVRPLAGETPEE